MFWCIISHTFQSTPPARGATEQHKAEMDKFSISIHAPREGGDSIIFFWSHVIKHFNPRPPRGGRLGTVRIKFLQVEFQSTPPARGATMRGQYKIVADKFQSTPPARGATPHKAVEVNSATNFNPRPPRGGRPLHQCIWISSSQISIHAPREGGDILFIPCQPV